MRDRLPGFKKNLESNGVNLDDWVDTFYAEDNANLSEDTQHFLGVSPGVIAELYEIKELSKKLKELHSLFVTETASNSTGLKNDIEIVEIRLKKKLNVVKDQLKEMDEELEVQQSVLPIVEVRIRRDQIAALNHTFHQYITEYNQVLLKYQEQCKRRLQRQLGISGVDKSDQEIEEMIESGQMSGFITSQMAIEFQDAKAMLENVEERHKEILHLEQSIITLYELFADMAYHVSQQSEMLDHIEFNVQAAADYLRETVPTLKKAHYYHKSSNPLVKLLTCYGAVRLCTIM